jgi:hypothetical protein
LKITSLLAPGLALFLFPTSSAIFAHHGFAVEFEQNVVTKMEFMNPHIYFYVDVKGKDGKVVNWAFEGGPPNVIYRQGWRKDTLKPGDVVTVKGFRAKDGTHLAACTTVTLSDGREMYAGSGGVSPNAYGQTGATGKK